MNRFLCLFAATLLGGVAVGQSSYSSDDEIASPHSVGIQAGIGWYFFLRGENADLTFTGGDDAETSYSVSINSSPTFGITYDYRIDRRFSVGGSLAHQRLSFADFEYRSGDADPASGGPSRLNVNRNFISVRGLVYYGRNPDFEMYSGLRLGLTAYGVKVKGVSEATNFDSKFFDNRGLGGFVLPHATIIPFGFRAHIDEHFYAGAETMFGSPHFFAAQVGYRF